MYYFSHLVQLGQLVAIFTIKQSLI